MVSALHLKIISTCSAFFLIKNEFTCGFFFGGGGNGEGNVKHFGF